MDNEKNLLGGKVTIHKSFRYRLQPNKKQEKQFCQFAGCARFIYNWGLARWGERYSQGNKTNTFDLNYELALLKKDENYVWLKECYSQILQQSLGNLGVAFNNFFKKKANYPQFKKKGRHDAFRFPQHFTITDKYLKLPKVGLVKYRLDRKIEGTAKSITISRIGEHWYASVLCEIVTEKKYNDSKSIVGIDVGIKHLATTYDGSEATHHSHLPQLQQAIIKLKKLQQHFYRKQKGSKNRNKARLKVAKQHHRIVNIRQDTLHKLTTALCKNHAAVAVEELCIKHMSKSSAGTVEKPGKNVAQKRGLNRSIVQQGWGILFQQLLYKANWYGSLFVLVSARHTSQTCPCCDFVAKENRPTQSSFKCLDCGYAQNADVVGAMNIRRRGMTCFG